MRRSGLIAAIHRKYVYVKQVLITVIWSLYRLQLTSSSVNKPGQNSRSSSKSNDLPASNRAREAEVGGFGFNVVMLRPPRNSLCEFWDADSRGALLDRPP